MGQTPLGVELVALAPAPHCPVCQGVTTAWPPACFTHVNLLCLPQQVSCVVSSRVYLLIVCSSSSQVKIQQAPMWFCTSPAPESLTKFRQQACKVCSAAPAVVVRQPEASSGFASSQAATPASCPTTLSALPTQCRRCPVLRLQPQAVALPVTQASITDIPTQMQARDPLTV